MLSVRTRAAAAVQPECLRVVGGPGQHEVSIQRRYELESTDAPPFEVEHAADGELRGRGAVHQRRRVFLPDDPTPCPVQRDCGNR